MTASSIHAAITSPRLLGKRVTQGRPLQISTSYSFPCFYPTIKERSILHYLLLTNPCWLVPISWASNQFVWYFFQSFSVFWKVVFFASLLLPIFYLQPLLMLSKGYLLHGRVQREMMQEDVSELQTGTSGLPRPVRFLSHLQVSDPWAGSLVWHNREDNDLLTYG